MNRDEIIRLAREAWRDTGEGWTALQFFDARAASFQRFAALVAAAEREACAKVCDALRDCEENTDGYRAGAGWCGEAIRARGT